MTDELAEFDRELARLESAIPRAHARAHAALVFGAFVGIVTRSPVRTGEYRASHEILAGESDRPAGRVFEHPQRPPPLAPAVQRPSPLPPPDLGAVDGALRGLEPFQRVELQNQKFYAGFVENGSANMPPRLIYERASLEAAARVPLAEALFFEELGLS